MSGAWIRRAFTFREDEEYGSKGWIPDDYPTGNACDPRMIAHDTIEHFPNIADRAPGTDELLALGAVLLARYDGLGQWDYRGAADNLASDVYQIIRNGWAPVDCPGRWGRHRHRDVAEQIATRAAQEWAGEERWGNPEEQTANETRAEVCAMASRWILKGYTLALKRYGDAHAAGFLFDEVRQLAETIPTDEFECEGCRIVVRVQPSTRRVCIDVRGHYDGDYTLNN